ncbi:Protein of unknown function [Tessaracoccus bendigoensis DSM 12906]|uniref:Uncharacterized protein n=1 Tax=Tessaracoccus bendigoensis DSM 12906 TaxID=1123357 RepID=A0A1M6IWW5_9ACTN|nr:type IV toxin-antitoxin system AbiEi family antitoxin domain-containing protein [Tessaracoccus bendigoensis]SHJ38920.1 Protein of unknown function [Tessaracoccus bendigoensis DSM 12906]
MRPTAQLPQALHELAASQNGVFSRPQVLQAGASQSMIDRQLRSGGWFRIGQGIYSAMRPDFESVCRAGILLAEGPASVGGRAAAHLYGLCPEPDKITIWGSRSRTQGPWLFRRGERRSRGALPRSVIEDAVLEAAAEGPPDAVIDVLSAALTSRAVTPRRIRERATELSNLRHRKMILEILPDLELGVQSTLEYHFLHSVMRAHALPEGARQVAVSEGTRSDILLEEFRLIIELDGRRGHEGDGKWKDAKRDNRHLLRGFSTLRFGWHDVVLHSCTAAAVVGAVLLNRGWPGVGGAHKVRRCGRRCTSNPSEFAA